MYRVKLLARPDGLDYTNVISKPASETLYPVEVICFLSYLQGYTNTITKTNWKKINDELANVSELIDVKAKTTEIDKSLSPIVVKDPGMQFIVKELKRLHESLRKIKIDNDEDGDENGDEDVQQVNDDNNEDGEKGMMQESGSRENKGYPRE